MVAKTTFDEGEIRDRLARTLPAWRYEDGALRRAYRTHSWKGTLMVVNTIGHLAEAAWHHPDLACSYSKVEVSLSSHDVKGITERDFALAEKIEAVVLWRPGAEGGPFEGTPADPRYAYLKYD